VRQRFARTILAVAVLPMFTLTFGAAIVGKDAVIASCVRRFATDDAVFELRLATQYMVPFRPVRFGTMFAAIGDLYASLAPERLGADTMALSTVLFRLGDGRLVLVDDIGLAVEWHRFTRCACH